MCGVITTLWCRHMTDECVPVEIVAPFAVDDVGPVGGQGAVLEGLDDRGLVHDPTAAGIDQDAPRLHPPQPLPVHQSAVGVREMNVQADHVRAGEQFVQRDGFDAVELHLAHVVAEDVHAKGAGILGDDAPKRPHPMIPQVFSANWWPRSVPVPSVRLGPRRKPRGAAGSQHQCPGQLGCGRDAVQQRTFILQSKDGDPAFGRRAQIQVVEPGGCRGDGLQRGAWAISPSVKRTASVAK